MEKRKIKGSGGYTLMELLMVMAVILVVLGSGMTAFYRTLRGGTRADIDLALDSGTRQMMNSSAYLIRHAEVESLSAQDKEDCLAAGSGGVTGTALVLRMVDGGETTLALVEDRLASSSAGLGDVFLAAEGLQLSDMSFKWNCQAGQKDKVEMSFTASWINEAGEASASKDFSFLEMVRNSGY